MKTKEPLFDYINSNIEIDYDGNQALDFLRKYTIFDE